MAGLENGYGSEGEYLASVLEFTYIELLAVVCVGSEV